MAERCGTRAALLMMLTCLCARAAARGTIKLESSKITLVCYGDSVESLPPLNSTAAVEVAEILRCPPPRETYAAALRVLAINVTAITDLSLTLHDANNPNAKHFENLNITTFNMRNDFASSIKLDADILDTLATARNLTLVNMQVPPLPELNRLVNVTLVDSVSRGEWGGCAALEKLELRWWELLDRVQFSTQISNEKVYASETEGRWLAHCRRLRELVLHGVTPALVRLAVGGARALVALTAHRCALTHLPRGMLADAVHLRTLNLSDNLLVQLDGSTFEAQPQLQVLDLSFNHLQRLKLSEILAPLKQLRDLSLEGNNAQNLIETEYEQAASPVALDRLSMRRTSMEWSYLMPLADTLSFLDLSNSNMTYLDINALMKFPSILVDLRGNNIFNIYPKRESGYQEMSDKYERITNVTILVDFPTNCATFEGRLPRMLLAMPRLALAGASCSPRGASCSPRGPSGAAAAPGEWRDAFPWSGCSHRPIFTSDNHLAIEVDCRGAETRQLPFNIRYANRVLASGNLIERLHVSDFSRSLLLEYIDLANNSISHIDANVTGWMFGAWGPRVRLAGNPLACDCANRELLDAMREYPDQVDDYDDITCAGDVRLLRDVNPDELCAEPPSSPWVAPLAVTIVALCLCAALCYRYHHQIEVYLFARGYRLSCFCVGKNHATPESSIEYSLFRYNGRQNSDGCDVEGSTTTVPQEYEL